MARMYKIGDEIIYKGTSLDLYVVQDVTHSHYLIKRATYDSRINSIIDITHAFVENRNNFILKQKVGW